MELENTATASNHPMVSHSK